MNRPSWDEYYLGMLTYIGERATCDRGRCACIVTLNNRILVTGYAGAPPKLPHCDEVGHEFVLMQPMALDPDGESAHPVGSQKRHCIRTVHAERNAINWAARHGLALNRATFYVSMTPCYSCAKDIIGVGAKRVVVLRRYGDDERTREIFRLAKVNLVVIHDEVMSYKKNADESTLHIS